MALRSRGATSSLSIVVQPAFTATMTVVPSILTSWVLRGRGGLTSFEAPSTSPRQLVHRTTWPSARSKRDP